MFKWEITLGDIALSVLGGLLTISIAIHRYWLQRYPFIVRFYEKPWNTLDDENLSIDWKILSCNKGQPEKFFIGVRLRAQKLIQVIDVRLVERRWWMVGKLRWKEAPKDFVTVSEAHDQEAILGGDPSRDNRKGGRELHYGKARNLPLDAILWYEVTAIAHKNWNGWLSVQLRRGSSRKGYGRAKICFKVSP